MTKAAIESAVDPLRMTDTFMERHLGPDSAQREAMLRALGLGSLEELIDSTVPASIQLEQPLELPESLTESEALAELRRIANENQVFRSFIGMGYHGTLTPGVIQRNILENPGWYTQYTPYQAEISQGRLEALLNFQTMVSDLAGLPLANSSLLDEGTAAAEAMAMAFNISRRKRNRFFVSNDCHPQTIAVVEGRAEPMGIEVVVGERRRCRLRRRRVLRRPRPVPDERRPRTRLRAAGRARPRARHRGDRGRRPARADRAGGAGTTGVRTSSSERPSASASRWASAARMPHTSPRAKTTSESSPAG